MGFIYFVSALVSVFPPQIESHFEYNYRLIVGSLLLGVKVVAFSDTRHSPGSHQVNFCGLLRKHELYQLIPQKMSGQIVAAKPLSLKDFLILLSLKLKLEYSLFKLLLLLSQVHKGSHVHLPMCLALKQNSNKESKFQKAADQNKILIFQQIFSAS